MRKKRVGHSFVGPGANLQLVVGALEAFAALLAVYGSGEAEETGSTARSRSTRTALAPCGPGKRSCANLTMRVAGTSSFTSRSRSSTRPPSA